MKYNFLKLQTTDIQTFCMSQLFTTTLFWWHLLHLCCNAPEFLAPIKQIRKNKTTRQFQVACKYAELFSDRPFSGRVYLYLSLWFLSNLVAISYEENISNTLIFRYYKVRNQIQSRFFSLKHIMSIDESLYEKIIILFSLYLHY